MTHFVRNTSLRAACLLVVGSLLVAFAEQTPTWLVRATGTLLIITGAVSLLSLFGRQRTATEHRLYPILGLATAVLGLLLAGWPQAFIKGFMYVLAALLCVAGIVQAVARFRLSRLGIRVGGVSYLVPAVTVGAGIFVLAYPMQTASLPFTIIGAAYVVYALLELTSAWQYRAYARKHPEMLPAAAGEVVVIDPETAAQ